MIIYAKNKIRKEEELLKFRVERNFVPHREGKEVREIKRSICKREGCNFKTYIPGRGQWVIMKAHGLGKWPSLHPEGAPA